MEERKDPLIEKKEILNLFNKVIKALRTDTPPEELKKIHKAFNIALDAHKDMRRKSGIPYIYHPLETALICVQEIGLGTTAVICALLHDVVEDTDYSIDDIKQLFGEKIASIIDGLTKISGIFNKENNISTQAENLKRMILTLGEDVRVILIKLADRLHNMRTLDALSKDKQLKVASETLFLFAPLAHRLGLYAIKTELEDLSLKYTEPQVYNNILKQLKESGQEREKFIKQFIAPLKKELTEKNIKAETYGRAKSIYSIWEKMRKKDVPFEEVFDILAVRIIIDSSYEEEKINCWKVYSIVTDNYKPNPDRLRDWISIPKANGYEALHTTVMSKTGKWVEVQIRTQRMDEIAEKGYAAHWKYKEAFQSEYENNLDRWLAKIRELLQGSESNALDFLSDFKMNLFADEVFVFTPKGELRTLPNGSSVLDFAYAIHTQLGNHCIAAKVNYNLVTRDYILKSGDQIEIITSDIQNPSESWLNQVATLRAKNEIKMAIKQEKKNLSEKGKKLLKELFKDFGLTYNNKNIAELRTFFRIERNEDLYYDVAINNIGIKEIKEFQSGKEKSRLYRRMKKNILSTTAPDNQNHKISVPEILDSIKNNSNALLLGDQIGHLKYTLSPCCNPIPGDEVVGFMAPTDNIEVHRTMCPQAIQLMSSYGNKIIKAKWNKDAVEFLAGIKFAGIDKPGVLNKIIRIISHELNLNISSISFDTNTGIFEGMIKIFVNDQEQINDMINHFKEIDEIKQVHQINRS